MTLDRRAFLASLGLLYAGCMPRSPAHRGRLEELYRAADPGRDSVAASGERHAYAGRWPLLSCRNLHLSSGTAGRSHRRLCGLHRHGVSCGSERKGVGRFRAGISAGKGGLPSALPSRRHAASGIQQQLCHGDAWRRRAPHGFDSALAALANRAAVKAWCWL